MQKIDLRKERSYLYKPTARKITTVAVPEINFLMIDGKGNPENVEFQEAVECLFSVSYTLKFGIKKGEIKVSDGALDYGVMPLEGLWWADDPDDFLTKKKDNWQWTLMIMQPDFIDEEMIHSARKKAARKKDLPALDKLYFKNFREGTSAQILYIGPFADEGPVIRDIHTYISENGGTLSGKHHEIYLSDFRRTAPEKLKTILRQPFRANTTNRPL